MLVSDEPKFFATLPISFTRELASSGVSLPDFSELGSAMSVPDREADEHVVFTGEMSSFVGISGTTIEKGRDVPRA
jgi:hypothetical protein